MTTFNGYYIWGLYLLEKVAFIINSLFYGGEFANLPRCFSLVSYGFLGLIAALPLTLFRRYIKLPALILATLLILYVPLGSWDYGVLGALGDMKFAVIFLAFLMLIYRHYLPANSKKIYLVDLAILICAYTNVTVYAMMPFALLRYWPQIKGRRIWTNAKKLVLTDRSALSLLVLSLALLPQLYVIKTNGVPAIPGYLDHPFNFKRTIEIFVSRSYLYEIFFSINRYLNDSIVVISLIAILGLGWRYLAKYRSIFIFSILTIFFSTFLFVVKRTGVSDFYIGYKDAGPAQFFFAQNWIFAFIFSILFVEIVGKLKKVRYQAAIYVVAVALFLIYALPFTGSFGKNDFQERTVGNIYAESKSLCAKNANIFNVVIYPTPDQIYPGITRAQLCTPSVLNYQPTEVSLGLKPNANNYVMLGTGANFTQTFKSPSNNLNGLDVFFSTFLRKPKSAYSLKVMDASCKSDVRLVNVHTSKITDNSNYTVLFPAIKDSAGKTYCFTIVASKLPADPLAVQLSAPDIYKDGVSTVNGRVVPEDIVFGLHYK